jgi:hypothetical protein
MINIIRYPVKNAGDNAGEFKQVQKKSPKRHG